MFVCACVCVCVLFLKLQPGLSTASTPLWPRS
uniref:Uncharacterized protein n=1 Tax=Anguilla anguilla TaxID=7936 RepID=A0A0E9RVF8_ANGAN